MVFPKPTATLNPATSWSLPTPSAKYEWYSCLWLVWEPIIFILHIWAPILDALYSKYTSWIFGRNLFAKGQLAGIKTITHPFFGELLIINIRETVVLLWLLSFHLELMLKEMVHSMGAGSLLHISVGDELEHESQRKSSITSSKVPVPFWKWYLIITLMSLNH